MSTDYTMHCFACREWCHLGTNHGFGCGEHDEEGRAVALAFVTEHCECVIGDDLWLREDQDRYELLESGRARLALQVSMFALWDRTWTEIADLQDLALAREEREKREEARLQAEDAKGKP